MVGEFGDIAIVGLIPGLGSIQTQLKWGEKYLSSTKKRTRYPPAKTVEWEPPNLRDQIKSTFKNS